MPRDSDFADFYAASYGRTLALAMAVLGDRHEAEDVAQEAFARALLRWPVLRRYDSPEAWVRRVALRLTVNARRRVARARRAMPSAPMTAAPAFPHVAGDLAVSEALLALPFRQRQVVVLHYHADLTVAQIARELRLPESTVKARLASGRRHLERELSGELTAGSGASSPRPGMAGGPGGSSPRPGMAGGFRGFVPPGVVRRRDEGR